MLLCLVCGCGGLVCGWWVRFYGCCVEFCVIEDVGWVGKIFSFLLEFF